MDDLDALLGRLAQAPSPASLNGLEARVLARISAADVVRVDSRVGAMTITAALFMGLVGAVVPPRGVEAASLLSPLGLMSPLAPSSLLLGEP